MIDMSSKNAYDIYFVGQDYQPISNAANSIKIMQEGKEFVIDSDGVILQKDEKNRDSDKEKARSIIDRFLDKVAPNGYCEELSNIYSLHGDKKKIYDANFVGKNSEKGYFCGVVGVIRKKIWLDEKSDELSECNVTLQIKSRLDVNDNDKISKPFFLATMLLSEKVKLNDNMIPCNEDEIFDYLLLFWFIEKLKNAHLKGYYKTYRRFENNDDKVKGTLDIARHIRLNAGLKNGRIAYSYRENTINNYLNQLIVAAYYHMKRKYCELVEENFDNNNELKGVIEFLYNETDYSNTSLNVILKKNSKAISHPYFTEYEELRIICLRILRDEGISIFDGESDDSSKGILFYLPDLWEMFLKDEVFKKALPQNICMECLLEVKNFDEKQKTFPDYVFFNNDRPFMILDAKCKPGWEDASRNENGLGNLLKDYDKCIRDMVAANSHATGVIYPTNKKHPENEQTDNLCHSISEYNKVDKFYTIPISVPTVGENDKYSDWRNKFDKILQEEINVIQKKIVEESEFAKTNADAFDSIVRATKK